jgi:UDP-N-acetylmuramate dehydrogenase
MASDDRYAQFVTHFDGVVKQGEPLNKYTTFRTGGPADLFVEAQDSTSLSRAIKLARELEIPHFLVGGGSNLLVSDKGFRGLIVRNLVRKLVVEGHDIIAGAGEDLDRVVNFATENGLTGFEFGAGIWGSIGGAVYGNAGAFGSQISAVLTEAELVDGEGNIRVESNEYFRFAYRHSYLKETKEIVTYARFGLAPGDKAAIRKRTEEIYAARNARHPDQPCSAGCFFKNIEDLRQPHGKLPAGKLLEEAGAKFLTVGGAAVFERHANIIVNKGNACSKDIRLLADLMKQKVKEKFNIELSEEVASIGDF